MFPHHENEIAQSQCGTGQVVRAPLDARQAPADRQRDDVEEQGQLLHHPRHRRPRTQARGDPLPAGGRALPQAAELRLRGAAAGRGRARADPRPRRAPGRGDRGRGRSGPAEDVGGAAAGRRSIARWQTTSTRRRRSPRCTGWSAAANSLLAAGPADAGRRRTHPARDRRHGRGLRRAAARAATRTGWRAEEQALFDERQAARRAREFARADAARAAAGGARASCSRTLRRARAGAGAGRPMAAERPAARPGQAGEDLACAAPAGERLCGSSRATTAAESARSTSSPGRARRWSSWRSRSAAGTRTALRSRPSPR